MNWLRFFAWSDYDTATGNVTAVVFRYPVVLKERFYVDFGGSGAAVLEQHPMMMHASMLERITTMTREIHFFLCDPMYELEEELGMPTTTSAKLYEIGRELTEYYRKIRQVKTDIDIVRQSTRILREQTRTLSLMMRVRAEKHSVPKPDYELEMQLDRTFDGIQQELNQCEVYIGLYSERCNTSITIAHSLSSQRSAEVSHA